MIVAKIVIFHVVVRVNRSFIECFDQTDNVFSNVQLADVSVVTLTQITYLSFIYIV